MRCLKKTACSVVFFKGFASGPHKVKTKAIIKYEMKIFFWNIYATLKTLIFFMKFADAHVPVCRLWRWCRACAPCPLMASVTPGAWSAWRGVTRTVIHVLARCQADGEGDISARCQVGTCSIMHQAWVSLLAGAPLWSAAETSAAWVFNHLASFSLLPINPSSLLLSLHRSHPSSLQRN